MKSVNEKYFQSLLEDFQKSLHYRKIYAKYSEKNSI